MKVLITGASGTVGTALTRYYQQLKAEVIPWDRQSVPVDNYAAMAAFIEGVKPDVLYHLAIASQPSGKENEGWMVNYEWSSELAWITRILNIPFVFTSTAMVFSDNATGPFKVDAHPDAMDGYGFQKKMAEERIQYQNPKVRIARLGWQIGEGPGSNNMVDFLENEFREKGEIHASTEWQPACSFLNETAVGLANILKQVPGIYHLDANRQWNFYQIASALAQRHQKNWQIIPTGDFVYDQRLLEEHIPLPPLEKALPELLEQREKNE